MFLTFTSASLLSVALVGNATQFSDAFRAFALTVLSIDLVVGLLTHVRVMSVGMEDLMYVLAMNRLRAAYIDLDPGIAPYFMMGTTDDLPGTQQTYYAFSARNRAQVFASSMMLILVVHAALVGLFGGAVTYALSGSVGWSIAVGVILALAAFVGWMAWGYRGYFSVWRLHRPLRRATES